MLFLQCGYEDGTDRLHLRLPMLLTHVIDADSPLVAWLQPGGLEQDLQSEIVVVVSFFSQEVTDIFAKYCVCSGNIRQLDVCRLMPI